MIVWDLLIKQVFERIFLNVTIIIILLQRPLKTIAIKSGDVYIPRGVAVPALDKDYLWEFEPKRLCK